MKTKFLKRGILLLAVITSALAVNAQRAESEKFSNFDIVSSNNKGESKETAHTFYKDHEYKLEFVNNKLTSLLVDNVKIAADKYPQYSTLINKIREQIRIDKIQAREDQAQAVKDQEQARIDEKQAVKDRAQAQQDQVQARRDQEQAEKDQAQAKLDEQQAIKDQIQAKLDQKQAEQDQRLMSEMISDLVKDGIVPDEKSVQSVSLNSTEMTVNGKKQPDEIFARYKAKYRRWVSANFTYGADGTSSTTIRMGKNE